MDARFFRGRRLRRTAHLRDVVRETHLRPEDLIMPYFVVESDDDDFEKPIGAMPGQSQLGLKKFVERAKQAADKGVRSLIIFGIPKEKDEAATEAYSTYGITQRAVHELKKVVPDMVVITDVCLCEYMSHGHCGVVHEGEVLNDESLQLLVETALSHARAGADIVAPSDMMDGRVAAIREALDSNGYETVPIMSYAVKYASSFYGPFREAAESAPQFGDRKSYQMDPANGREALREAQADVQEGADMLLVKPAGPYLDIVRAVRERFDLPLCAYQVSGEYSMIKAGGEKGWIDEKNVIMESLIGIKRAGADLIISYFTEEIASSL